MKVRIFMIHLTEYYTVLTLSLSLVIVIVMLVFRRGGQLFPD